MRAILTSAIVLFLACTTWAQDPTPRPAHRDKPACILADASTWADLGLDAGQLTKVRAIQAEFRKANDAAKATGRQEEGVEKVEQELKAVLSPEQFTKWTQWCDANKAMKDK